ELRIGKRGSLAGGQTRFPPRHEQSARTRSPLPQHGRARDEISLTGGSLRGRGRRVVVGDGLCRGGRAEQHGEESGNDVQGSVLSGHVRRPSRFGALAQTSDWRYFVPITPPREWAR